MICMFVCVYNHFVYKHVYDINSLQTFKIIAICAQYNL